VEVGVLSDAAARVPARSDSADEGHLLTYERRARPPAHRKGPAGEGDGGGRSPRPLHLDGEAPLPTWRFGMAGCSIQAGAVAPGPPAAEDGGRRRTRLAPTAAPRRGLAELSRPRSAPCLICSPSQPARETNGRRMTADASDFALVCWR
jgi:hypothetical protein